MKALHEMYKNHLRKHYAPSPRLLDPPTMRPASSDPIISHDITFNMEIFGFKVGIDPTMMKNPEIHIDYITARFRSGLETAVYNARMKAGMHIKR